MWARGVWQLAPPSATQTLELFNILVVLKGSKLMLFLHQKPTEIRVEHQNLIAASKIFKHLQNSRVWVTPQLLQPHRARAGVPALRTMGGGDVHHLRMYNRIRDVLV